MAEKVYNVSVFDYKRNKLCDLYDSQVNLTGQAFGIKHDEDIDGLDTLDFSIPYMVDDSVNFRWAYLKSEYLIRLAKDDKYIWFIAQRPKKSKRKEIIGTVHCESIAVALKTKNISKYFDDENGIGTIEYLLNQIIAGTEWELGDIDPMYEKDGETEKVRSLSSNGNDGALALIQRVCNLFRARPVFDTDKMTIDVRLMNNRDQVVGLTVGHNLDAIDVQYDSKDIITRMYVEGEYGDHGYVGIDDVNPTGLPYLVNFDYYKEIGVFTAEHQAALNTYLSSMHDIVEQIKENQEDMTLVENALNALIGQCVLSAYYTDTGFNVPKYTYGSPTEAQQALNIGDKVYVFNEDKTFRTATIETTPGALIHSGDYCIAKFATPSAGSTGAKEAQIDAKNIEIGNLERKRDATTKPDKKAEYQSEIDGLRTEIRKIYEDEDGLYDQMYEVFKPDGLLSELDGYQKAYTELRTRQDSIEADFIIAMDNMLRDGKWTNNNYVIGQEQELYDDAVDVMAQMSKPTAAYTLDYVRLAKEYDVPLEDIQINAIVRAEDEELELHDNMFITHKSTGIDDESYGEITISNKDIKLGEGTLSQLLSRMSQLSDMIDQKNAIYERAKAISKSGTFYADRLNGNLDVMTTKIMSSVSNWYTDDNGNLVFLSADGGSAVMLSGAGMLLASSKKEDGSWNWRAALDGTGMTADEIVAGFLSADRIEAGSIATSKVTADFGSTIGLDGNPSITNLQTEIDILPGQIVSYVGRHGFGKTFVQLNDPAMEIDPETGELKYTILPNDVWIKATPDPGVVTWGEHKPGSWGEMQEEGDWYKAKISGETQNRIWREYRATTWGEIKNSNWGNVHGEVVMYYRTAEDKWEVFYDHAELTEQYTRITQNERMIELEAVRSKGEEEKLRASISITAEAITSEVTRATKAEGTLSSRITQTAEAITSEVTRASQAEGQLSSRITQTATAITSEVTRATNSENQLSSRITQTAESITAEVTRATTEEGKLSSRITQTAESISSEVTRATTAEGNLSSRITQTAESISSEVTRATTAEGSLSSRITQNAEAITAEVTRATNAENTKIAKTTQYQTADAIVTTAQTYASGVANTAESNAKSYAATVASAAETNAKNASIARTEVYQTAAAIVSTAEAYADGVAATAETNAKNASILRTAQLQTADAIVSTAESYASGVAATAESNAKSYAASVASTAETNAKNASIARTDTYQSAAAIVSTAETYAAGVAGTAESNAKSYADGVAGTAESSAKSYADSVAAAAEENAKGASIARTLQYQDANSIVLAAETYTDDNAYAKVSGIAITASGIDITGSKYVNITSGENYVKLNSGGIDIKGSKVTITESSGEKCDLWGRNDIVVMNPNETDPNKTWRKTVADIESHMSGKHDWVLVRPYYDAQILYNITGINKNVSEYSNLALGKNSEEAFGDAASGYSYDLTVVVKRTNANAQPSLYFRIYATKGSDRRTIVLGSGNFSASGGAEVYTGQSEYYNIQMIRTASGIEKEADYGGIIGNWIFRTTLTAGAGAGHNLAGDGYSIFMDVGGTIYGSGYAYVQSVEIVAHSNASTSRVPCTVYYYP